MKKRISFFKRLIISITSVKKYKELINEKFSKSIIYSLIFSLLIGCVIGGLNFAKIESTEKAVKEMMSRDEFKFTLENGILEFENSPYKLEEGQNIIYIDADISLSDVDSIRKFVVHKDISTSLLKDGISYRVNGEEYNFKYSDMKLGDKLDNNDIINSLGFIDVVKYVAFILGIIITYLGFMFNAFILSILGAILNKINYLNLSYGDVFKICIYATTLPTILGLFLPLGAFSMIISGIYLVLTINYLRSEITL